MKRLRFTLITDGSSDKALIPIIHWLLSQHYPNLPLDGEWLTWLVCQHRHKIWHKRL